MKKIIIILFLTINSFSNAEEFLIDGTGKAEMVGITFNDKSKYRVYKSNGHWKASSGDYGLSECFGTVRNYYDDKVDFEVYCKLLAQDKEHFVMKFITKRDTQESGIGQAIVVDTSKKYKFLLNAKCNHAITYIDLDYFSIQKCNY